MSKEININVKDVFVMSNCFYVGWHDKLIELFEWVTVTLDMIPEILITSAYRPGDKGVHGTDPLRAIDLSSKGYDAKAVAEKINEHWQYNSSKPLERCAIFRGFGRCDHLHLQVSDETIIIRGGW
jgi:hypothetical protein